MTPIRTVLGPAICLHVLLAGCGDETGSSAPEQEAAGESIAVYAPEASRRINVVLPAFQSTTGIGYSFVSPDAVEPMSQADIYFGASFVDLWEMAEAGLLRPVAASLNERVAAGGLTDPERRFIPLATAPRAVAFNRDLVSDDEIRTIVSFESLADDRWKGRLCLSTSRVDGNRLLVAHLINRHDAREAEITVRRWLQNLAAAVYQGDDALAAAIAERECALGILDLRLLGRADSPTGVGFHTFTDPDSWLFDIAGAGISRHASNADAASVLLDWLLSVDGNDAYAADWPDMPLGRESIERRMEEVGGVTTAIAGAASLAELGFLLDEADLLIERAGYH
jgi:iron(III) transport system substrate-binding protein